MRKHFFLSILFLSAIFELTAQPSASAFVRYTTDQGLSNDFVKDITKDQRGFLWIATINGLNRFDGYQFRKFHSDPEDPEGLPDNHVQFLTLAPDGYIWAAGHKGICRIDPVSLTFRSVKLPENQDSLDNDATGKVVFDRQGKGWVVAASMLYCMDLQGAILASYPVDRVNAGFFSTYLDSTGKIWMINEGSISYFDCRSKKIRTLQTDTPGNPLNGCAPLHVREDQKGQRWVSTWYKGLALYDPVLDSLLDFPDRNPLATIILPDTNDNGEQVLWLGGGNYGLYIYWPDTDRDFHFSPDPRDPFTHNLYMATALMKDPADGSIWIGTEAGLEHYAPASVRFNRVILPIDENFGQFSLMSDVLRDFTDRSGNTYYIAVWGSGILKWDRRKNEFKHLHKTNSGLRNDLVFCVMQDRKGYIWAGIENGVSRYDPRTGLWRSWDCYVPSQASSATVLSCIEDRDGGLWFGTNRGGLFHYNAHNDKMEPVDLPQAACHKENRIRISAMSLDRNGNIWMATLGSPIRFEPRSRQAKAFVLNGLRPIYNQWSDVQVARNGRLYATSHDSFLELDSLCNVLRRFDQENGLQSNQVYRVEEDRAGHIWLNTNHLLHCFDPASGRFTYFGTADGLFKNTITDGLTVLPGGELFIGFQNAFNFVDPDNLRMNPTPPPVVFTMLKVMDRERMTTVRKKSLLSRLFNPYSLHKTGDTLLVVLPGEKIFSIGFAALNYNQPSRNRYAYKLEGFDNDWVYTDLNFVTYTNIEEGEYIFHVKAANNDGVWNNKGARLRIKVIPVITRRWYFQASMGLLGVLMLIGIALYRRKQRNILEEFRERLARDLHDEMGSTLSSIRFFSEFARQQTVDEKPEVGSVLQRISQSANSLSESMQDIVWAMKTKNDQLEDLATRMTEFGLRMLEARNIRFVTKIGTEFAGRHLKPDTRRNLYLIFKEAVNNAAKYGGATEVTLYLAVRKGILHMSIHDNGVGFNPEAVLKGNGNGLRNMRQRAIDINGQLTIDTKCNEGTTIRVLVRV